MGWLSPRQAKDSDGLYRFFGGSLPDPEFPASNFLTHVGEGYDKSELVFRCINEGATSLPEGTLRVYDALGRRGEPLQDHPLRTLLSAPNPLLTEFELFEVTALHLDLAGNAFWEIVRDRAGRVSELWPLRPDKVHLKRGVHQLSYGYVVGSKIVPVEAVHFRLPSPVDPLVGTPPMRSALRMTAVDNQATSFVKALLGNSAIPGVVVTMGDLETVLDDEVTRRLSEKWKARFGGRRRGEPAFLQTGMDVKQIGLNLKDLEFPDLRGVAESRICMAFETPPMLVGAKVGLEHATYSNMGEARKSFWEQKIMPRQRRIRDTIALQLLPLVDPGGRGRRKVSLRWDNSEVTALRESEESRWTRATEGLRAGGMTVNDWRREVGLPDVTGGDVFLVPSGVIATRDVQGVNELVDAQDATPASESAAGKAIEPRETKASSPLRDQAERTHEKTLRDYFEARRGDVAATVGGKAALVNQGQWDADLTERLYKVGLAAATAAGVSVSADYDRARTENYQYKRAQGIASDMNTALVAAATAALLADDPEQAITDLFAEYANVKAVAYAVTLATTALGWGATEAGRQATQAGRKATKTWRTGPRPREAHAAMDGETVGADEPFSNGMHYPGDGRNPDEVAGCNCSVTVNIE